MPKFWSRKTSRISILLEPMAQLYHLGYQWRRNWNRQPYISTIPVVCVGNLNVGGSGKTPTAIALAKLLQQHSKTCCFLSRGYGGSSHHQLIQVNTHYHTATEVGDEPLLLAEWSDTFVVNRKVIGLQWLNKNFRYDYILLDDGLQNPTFHKNKTILVVDGYEGFGNGRLLPAGPLRETLSDTISAGLDMILLVGPNYHLLEELHKYSLPVLTASLKPTSIDENKKYVAFCGIAYPEKFKRTLEELNLKITSFVTFGDHHFFTQKDIKFLANLGGQLLTTKKDWVRLQSDIRPRVNFLDVQMQLDNPDQLWQLLATS
jgi:tetraacyldisaccharide 4'-kinase